MNGIKVKKLEKEAPSMSTRELNSEIDKRIKLINSGLLEGGALEEVKESTAKLAEIVLRRGS